MSSPDGVTATVLSGLPAEPVGDSDVGRHSVQFSMDGTANGNPTAVIAGIEIFEICGRPGVHVRPALQKSSSGILSIFELVRGMERSAAAVLRLSA
jgi:hypothetical protein